MFIPPSSLTSSYSTRADCSICLEGYSPDVGQACSRCSRDVGFVVRAWIVAIPGILAIVLLLCYLIPNTSTRRAGASRGLLSLLVSWRRRLLSLKIVVIVWQIITQARMTIQCLFRSLRRALPQLTYRCMWHLTLHVVSTPGICGLRSAENHGVLPRRKYSTRRTLDK